MKGKLFDIQRFALNDGPGIRATIFLQGCPLRCLWCHNPESWEYESGTAFEMEAEEILEIVQKDIPYFIKSGGGITISGGEPLSQAGFTVQILTRARKNNIHTCLDTSGHASWDSFEKTVPVTDLILFDYKATAPGKHKRLTGVDNHLIMSNLKKISDCNVPVILRCPLVSGVNDDENHLMAIAGLPGKYRNIREVHIMPYHSMAAGKCNDRDKKHTCFIHEDTKDEEKAEWHEKIIRFGCQVPLLTH